MLGEKSWEKALLASRNAIAGNIVAQLREGRSWRIDLKKSFISSRSYKTNT